VARVANFFAGKALAANRGKGFEAELQETHTYYQRMELAWVCRLHVRTAMSRGSIVYLEKAWVDFSGFLPGGRAVLVEAKSRATEAKLWHPDRPHQLSILKQANAVGALGFYLIRNGLDSARLWIPPDDYNGEGIKLAELPEIRRQWREEIWDWLQIIPR
jgi:hypothetical protein